MNDFLSDTFSFIHANACTLIIIIIYIYICIYSIRFTDGRMSINIGHETFSTMEDFKYMYIHDDEENSTLRFKVRNIYIYIYIYKHIHMLLLLYVGGVLSSHPGI